METALTIFLAAGAFVCSGVFWWLVFKSGFNFRSPTALVKEAWGNEGDDGGAFLLLFMLAGLGYLCYAFLERAFYG